MSKCVRGSWARAPRGCVELSYMSWTEYPSGGGESDRSETVFIFVKGRVRFTRDLEDRKRMARLWVVLGMKEDQCAQVIAASIEGGEMRQND
jgi:hypothetical protein